MQPLTTEWTRKAEADLATARRELRARTMPNYDAACFHAQQCAEKYLKALLQEMDTPFGRTHNLSLLLDLLNSRHPQLELLRPTLTTLTAYSVEYRYPGDSADKETARQAVKMAEKLKDELLSILEDWKKSDQR
jgi:HEPN domain-containing protein